MYKNKEVDLKAVRVNIVISKGNSTRNWDQTCGSELYYCQLSDSAYYCFWQL